MTFGDVQDGGSPREPEGKETTRGGGTEKKKKRVRREWKGIVF